MDYKSKWEKNPWKPKKIIYEPTDERLTATAGLGPLIDAFMQSPEFAAFKVCLPERIGNSNYSAEHLALILLCGFWCGHEVSMTLKSSSTIRRSKTSLGA